MAYIAQGCIEFIARETGVPADRISHRRDRDMVVFGVDGHDHYASGRRLDRAKCERDVASEMRTVVMAVMGAKHA